MKSLLKVWVARTFTSKSSTRPTPTEELGTKHFLGRQRSAGNSQVVQPTWHQGIRGFVGAMVNSAEYAQVFGKIQFLPSLPHTTGSQSIGGCINQLTKQSDDLVVPSFEPVQPRMATEKMPMTAKAIADIAAKLASSPVRANRSFNDGRGQSVDVRGTTRRKPARFTESSKELTQPKTNWLMLSTVR